MYVERPSIAPAPGGSTLLVGNPTIIWGSAPGVGTHPPLVAVPDSADLAGISIDRSGRVMAVPGDARLARMWSPRVSVDSGGGPWALDVIYGGRAPGRASFPDDVVDLWYTRFEGGRWSAPERIYADTVMWGDAVPPLVRLGDTLESIVPTKLGQGGSPRVPLMLLRRARGRWTTDVLPIDGVYAALAPVPGGLVTAYVTVSRDARIDHNSLYVSRSTRERAGWSTGQLIHSAGNGNVEDPVLLARGDSLWLAWIESVLITDPRRNDGATAATRSRDSIGMALSADGGRTWRRMPPLPVGGAANGLFALEHDGGIHLTYRMLGADRVRQAYAVWRGTSWRRAELLDGPEPASHAVLAVVRDTLWIAWGHGVPVRDGVLPILGIVRRPLRCAAESPGGRRS
ncbi:MAG TPA: hypothetical protein VJU87_06565 [Gemmatimonadaceae bacterium]|nr:hypothetical protein [Gemmatimonadaceae bacterium]